MALFRTLPTPTNDLLPRLMVEVCLVLAPDVNFFLNSRKQGNPLRGYLVSVVFSFLFFSHVVYLCGTNAFLFPPIGFHT